MGFHRANRLAEEMKKEVSQILREEIKDPRVGFVSVTRVEVSSDLRYAKVFISVLGSQEERQEVARALKRAGGFIRSELARRIRLRFTPELTFKIDDSIEHGVRIANILDQVKNDDLKSGGMPDGES
ncbi:MAG: 30S ribosome-binding factor RbfA [Bacillota bacterium]